MKRTIFFKNSSFEYSTAVVYTLPLKKGKNKF